MHTKTLKELSALLHSKQISATELAQLFLDRIAQSDLNAFLHVDPALTLKEAALADQRLASGDTTVLTGIPIAHKDIFRDARLAFYRWFEDAGKLRQPLRCHRG